MIDGLKLTMTGVQLRANLEGRIRWHQGELGRLSKQLAGPAPLLESEISRAERQIEILTFIRDYVVADEVYRLGEFDLRFADLLPDDDGWDCGCRGPGGPLAGWEHREEHREIREIREIRESGEIAKGTCLSDLP